MCVFNSTTYHAKRKTELFKPETLQKSKCCILRTSIERVWEQPDCFVRFKKELLTKLVAGILVALEEISGGWVNIMPGGRGGGGPPQKNGGGGGGG